MDKSIEDALKIISYPPKYPLNYPTLSKLLDRFYKLKIFSLESLLIRYCSEKSEIEKELALPTQEHHTALIHDLSSIVLPEPFQTTYEISQEIHPNGNTIQISCQSINELLNGGIRTKHLTELSGEIWMW